MSSSPEAGPDPTAAAAPAAAPHFGENKGIKFQIQTGNRRWACTLQDRASYERKKAARQDSTDSVSSAASSN